MDQKFKTKDKPAENRKSLIFWPNLKRDPDINSRIPIPSLTTRGNESSRFLHTKTKPEMKKSASQCSSDLQNLFQNHLKSSKENKVPLSKSKPYSSKLLDLPQRPLLSSNLPPAPIPLPQVSSKFYQDLCRLEPRLSNFYLNVSDNINIYG